MVDLSKFKLPGSSESKLIKAASLAETKNWYKDRYQVVTLQRNVLLIFTLVIMVGLVLLVNYVAILSDSKIFEPFVIEVDDKTGIVTRVDSKSIENMSADEAVIRSLLHKYVVSRESYRHFDYRYKYRSIVRVYSEKDVYRNFRFAIASSQENSPLNLQDKALRDAQVKSISFLESGKAQVRIVVYEKTYPDMQLIEEKHYISTVNFEFDAGLELSQDNRYLNPLGFRVIGYARDVEAIK